MKVFSVYDSKAQGYLPPFFCVNAAVALRSFQSAVQDSGHDFHRYSGDYTLFELGEWDSENGKFENLLTPHNLGVAVQFLMKGKEISNGS